MHTLNPTRTEATVKFFKGEPVGISNLAEDDGVVTVAVITYQEGILVRTREAQIPLYSGAISSLFSAAQLLDIELVRKFGHYQGSVTTPLAFAEYWLDQGRQVNLTCHISIHFDQAREQWCIVYVCDPNNPVDGFGIFLDDEEFEFLLEDCGHYITTIDASITDSYPWSIKGSLKPSGAILSLSGDHLELTFPDGMVFTTTDQDKFLWMDLFDAHQVLWEGRIVGSKRLIRSWGEDRKVVLTRQDGHTDIQVTEFLLGETVLEGCYSVPSEEHDRLETIIRGYYAMHDMVEEDAGEGARQPLEDHVDDDDESGGAARA